MSIDESFLEHPGRPDGELPPTAGDRRLYVPFPEEWEVRLKQGWDKDHCFMKNPGEDFFHLLLHGEFYVQRGDEKYCLNCAMRRRIVTTDRLYWQSGSASPPDAPLSGP